MDYVEAFTPAPSSDMSLAEALEAWPDKVLWINFPSAAHLGTGEEIKRTTRGLLEAARADEARCGRSRLILGITEDVPADRWQESLSAISEACHGG
jgi:hypothetical protein